MVFKFNGKKNFFFTYFKAKPSLRLIFLTGLTSIFNFLCKGEKEEKGDISRTPLKFFNVNMKLSINCRVFFSYFHGKPLRYFIFVLWGCGQIAQSESLFLKLTGKRFGISFEKTGPYVFVGLTFCTSANVGIQMMSGCVFDIRRNNSLSFNMGLTSSMVTKYCSHKMHSKGIYFTRALALSSIQLKNSFERDESLYPK